MKKEKKLAVIKTMITVVMIILLLFIASLCSFYFFFIDFIQTHEEVERICTYFMTGSGIGFILSIAGFIMLELRDKIETRNEIETGTNGGNKEKRIRFREFKNKILLEKVMKKKAIKILYVNDRVNDQNYIRPILRDEGWGVSSVTSLQDTDFKGFDLIILDEPSDKHVDYWSLGKKLIEEGHNVLVFSVIPPPQRHSGCKVPWFCPSGTREDFVKTVKKMLETAK